MKRLPNYLLVLLILPMSAMGQQQVVIKEENEIKYMGSKSNFGLRYSLPPKSDSFYKKAKVKSMNVYKSGDEHYFTLWFDKKGKRTSSLMTNTPMVVREHFSKNIKSVSTLFFEGNVMQAKDSFFIKDYFYKHLDTEIIIVHYTFLSFKKGSIINARNERYNQRFYNKKAELPEGNLSIAKQQRIDKAFLTTYKPDSFYLASKEFYIECYEKIDNYRFGNPEDIIHKRLKKYYKPKQSSVFVDGENFIVYEERRSFNERHCGTGPFNEAMRERDLKWNSKVYTTQNIKGLNDSVWSYYYPQASEQEIKEGNFTESIENSGTQAPTANTRITKRSKTPKPTLLYTIRYEYYKD